jgi:transcriptional regulator with XRE-family HTH domain
VKRGTLVANQAFYVALGKTLRGFRVLERVTLRDMAARLGVTHRTLERYEAGTIWFPMHIVFAVANELDLSLDFDVFPVTKEERKSA